MKQFWITLFYIMGISTSCTPSLQIETLNAQEYHEAITQDSTAIILDVRRPEEYNEGHLPNAISLDYLNQSVFKEQSKTLDRSSTYYIYCRSGKRSRAAAEFLHERGFRVYDLKNGIEAWSKKGFPICK